MQKFEIEMNLRRVAEAKVQTNAAIREAGLRVDKAMTRLIHEAAAQRMSVPQVAKLSGFTTAQIKARMKAMNLNPTTGKTLLSKQAADVLEGNAAILGIEPSEIDLMSPLAYLPAGSLLKEKVSSVTDLDEKSFMETLYDRLSSDGYIRFHIKGEAHEVRVDFIEGGSNDIGLTLDNLARLAQADEAGA